MNYKRIAVLGVAALAAGIAALLVRGMLGGGTQGVQASLFPEKYVTVEILVAVEAIAPGRPLSEDAVRWQAWPESAVAAEFMTFDDYPEIAEAIDGAVVRAPLVAGEPITETKIVRAGNASFMAATITSGKRAIAIPISEELGAGGFVLPNDRVDVILTRQVEQGETAVFQSNTILQDVRVLAIDQVLRQEDDQQFVVASTVTLELSPFESVLIAQAQATGILSLALRALGDNAEVADGVSSPFERPKINEVTVIRDGIATNTAVGASRDMAETE